MAGWMIAASFSAAGAMWAQPNAAAERDAPFPPFKVIGNIYYVGTGDLGSYLITTPQGDILVNTDYEHNVLMIRASVEKLGFKFSESKSSSAATLMAITWRATLWRRS
jgi:hypothetical protein